MTYTEPIGSPKDPAFSFTDMLAIDGEFTTGPAYFANASDTVVCIPSVLNPAIQWCSTKAVAWEPPAYSAAVYVQEPHQLAPVPEPDLAGALLVMLIALVWIGRRMW